MAQNNDETRKKPKKGQTALTWLMTGMLIVGLAGFSAGNFGGTITSIGSVGDIRLTTDDYVSAFRSEVAQQSQRFGAQISTQAALENQLDRQALANLISRASLDHTAQVLGLSVGDQTVAAEIMKQRNFVGASGNFDPNVYRSVLAQAGMKETTYETELRADVARNLLTGAVAGGLQVSPAVVEAIYTYYSERRSFSLIRLSETDLTAAPPALSDADIRAYYDAELATQFTQPEAKRLRYVALQPDDLAADQSVDEAELRALYDSRLAEYVTPARRLLDRLVYPDQAAADAALLEAQNGKAFEDLVAERGLTMIAVDMGDVAEADLGAAGAAVFAASDGAVVAADSDLGPALYRVNGRLDANEIPFETARADLETEVRLAKAREAIKNRLDELDDLLAGGATLDEIASVTGMRLASVDFRPSQTGDAPIESFNAFRQEAAAITPEDFPRTIVLDDGGLMAMEFVETIAAAPIPYDEALPQVIRALEAQRRADALVARADEIVAAVAAGADLASQGPVETGTKIDRNATLEQAPITIARTLFEMELGEVKRINDGPLVAVLRLDAVEMAENDAEAAEALRSAIRAQFEQAVSQDAFTAFAQEATTAAGMRIDQNAIDLVNASLQ